MAREIERKFLVKDEGWRSLASASSKFLQAYIAMEADRSVRVRIVDERSARLTIKIGSLMRSRDEFEYEIPLTDARELARQAVGTVLEKTRYKVQHEGYLWEIDVYAGAYSGLIVAEVEMQSEDENPPLPGWIGREITGDRRYSNAVMAKEDLSGELVDGLSTTA